MKMFLGIVELLSVYNDKFKKLEACELSVSDMLKIKEVLIKRSPLYTNYPNLTNFRDGNNK
jgi:hypothetical protein